MTEAEALCEHAQSHGDAEGSEAQIGDLETLFTIAFGLLSPEQREAFYRDEQVVDLLEVPEYSTFAPDLPTPR